jgi:hypothetical protein
MSFQTRNWSEEPRRSELTLAKRIGRLETQTLRGDGVAILNVVYDGIDEPRSPTKAEIEAAAGRSGQTILVWDGGKFRGGMDESGR